MKRRNVADVDIDEPVSPLQERSNVGYASINDSVMQSNSTSNVIQHPIQHVI